jgi:hypothetical protein
VPRIAELGGDARRLGLVDVVLHRIQQDNVIPLLAQPCGVDAGPAADVGDSGRERMGMTGSGSRRGEPVPGGL